MTREMRVLEKYFKLGQEIDENDIYDIYANLTDEEDSFNDAIDRLQEEGILEFKMTSNESIRMTLRHLRFNVYVIEDIEEI